MEPAVPIEDSEGLRRAYEDENSTYVEGDTLFVAGTKNLWDWANNPKIVLRRTDATPRYEQAKRSLNAMPQVRRVVGHSLGGAVALQLQKERPELHTRTYGAPVASVTPGDRFREVGDPVAAMDFGAKTSLPGGNPHSYERLAAGKYHTPPPGVGRSSYMRNGVWHLYR